MENLNEDCLSCGKSINLKTHYQVRKAVKPPHTPNRWKVIGYCCEKCHDNNLFTDFEKDPWREKSITK